MHNKPHTEAAKAKMRAAVRPRKWGGLPEKEIVGRLLETKATTRSIASEYGCSDSTIKIIFRKWTTRAQRLQAKNRKQGDAKRGRPNPSFRCWRKKHDVWTGRKHTDATKQKQSIAKKGTKHTLQQRIAQSARMQGVSIEEWQEFASTKTDRLKSSQEYVSWRQAVFARDDWICQECKKHGKKLHPHHIKSKSIYPELMFEVSNGITLCVPCHRKTDSYGVNVGVGS